mmetsp:Transcript_33596/g.72387  ORF Transcript_33596/g.72387 Transcript_33596/m.72387 type:complete len:258 (-) Transcript_33596:415-1188(-)
MATQQVKPKSEVGASPRQMLRVVGKAGVAEGERQRVSDLYDNRTRFRVGKQFLYQTSIHGVHINLQDLHVFHIGAVVFQKLSDVVRLGLDVQNHAMRCRPFSLGVFYELGADVNKQATGSFLQQRRSWIMIHIAAAKHNHRFWRRLRPQSGPCILHTMDAHVWCGLHSHFDNLIRIPWISWIPFIKPSILQRPAQPFAPNIGLRVKPAKWVLHYNERILIALQLMRAQWFFFCPVAPYQEANIPVGCLASENSIELG